MKTVRRSGFLLLVTIGFIVLSAQGSVQIQPEENLKNIFTPILCYHRVVPKPAGIYDLTPEMLEEQIQWMLAQGYRPITALQYIKLQEYPQFFPDKPVMLTFDDGSKGHYQYVFPILQKYQIKATFFVYPANIATKSDYQLTWAELKKMARAGMDIQSHTFTHPFLTKTKYQQDDPRYLKWLDRELKDSRLVLEQNLRSRVNLLAYSYGWFNEIVETKAFEAGYQGVFTVNWGVNRTDENPFRLKRRAVSNQMSKVELRRYLTSKPLALEIISPPDAGIVSEIPAIRFKLSNRELGMTDMVIGKYKGVLKPDREGTFSAHLKKIDRGYNTVIISGYDEYQQLYIDSWGFDFNPEAAKNTPAVNPPDATQSH